MVLLGTKYLLCGAIILTASSMINRFTNSRYSSKVEDIYDGFVHLTNVAIQKTAENYDSRTGGKMELQSLKLYLIRFINFEKYLVKTVAFTVYFIRNLLPFIFAFLIESCSKHGVERIDALFWEMQMIILRSLLAVTPIMISDKHCFELYGYDIIIDENLKPW